MCGVHDDVTLTGEGFNIDTYVSRGSLITADTILLFVTWSTLPRHYGLGKSFQKRTLSNVLLRNGMLATPPLKA